MKETTGRDRSRKMSLSTRIFWEEIVLGALWILVSVISLFAEIRLLKTLHLLLLLGMLFISLTILKAPTDNYDEMALAHRQQAKAKTLDILSYSLIGIAVAAFSLSAYSPTLISELLSRANFNLVMCSLWLIVGLKNIICGLIFLKLEAS